MRKVHYLSKTNETGQSLKAGRDAFFRVARSNGLLIKARKRYYKTTDSKHWQRQYEDLIKDLDICVPDQVWVADITYLGGRSELYLHLVTDAYSKKIMGWHLAEDLSATSTVHALEMAVTQRVYIGPLIHHSDRGLQYLSKAYAQSLGRAGICSSSTQNGSPYENPVAERINGILKQEFGLERKWPDIDSAKIEVKQAVHLYNHMRPHYSNCYLTPEQMHGQQIQKIRTYRLPVSP